MKKKLTNSKLDIAVIGGGINGLCTAWELASNGHQVTLFESDGLMQKTSMASSKLLHGGLRYLEQFEFRLVKEALQERKWWLKNVPRLTRRLPLIYPIYSHSRSRWKIKLGMMFYDFLAGKKGIGRHRWLTANQVKRCSPHLIQENLKGAYLFADGQMDDRALGLWVAKQCRSLNVNIKEKCRVKKINQFGLLESQQGTQQFDRIVNVAGPWSVQLLEQSKLNKEQQLDLVRGSHLLLPHVSKFGHMLEVPNEKRIVFVLPFKGDTLLGTTEVKQTIDEPIECSDSERDYMLTVYNYYFEPDVNKQSVISDFAGVRPLLTSEDSISNASREYRITCDNQLINVFGGKWTTSRALARAVAAKI